MPSYRTLAAALVAVLALPASAQTRAGDEARRAAGQGSAQPAQQPQAGPAAAPAASDPAGQPAAGPAAAPAASAAAGQPGQQQPGMQLSQEQFAAIATVMARNNLATRVGDLAATRGTTPEIQGLGRQLAEDHRRLQGELEALVRARGMTDLTRLPAPADQERLEGEFQRLNTLTGPEFDREATEFLTRNGNTFVDSLKRARDVTPGKDAQLKKFLDDAENVEENHLASSRRVKSNRQARTPPAR